MRKRKATRVPFNSEETDLSTYYLSKADILGEQLEKTMTTEEAPNDLKQSSSYKTHRNEVSLLTKNDK